MDMLIRLDYATMNFDKGTTSIRDISQKLAGGVNLRWTQKGLNENAPQYSPLGLRYMDNSGYDQAPHKLQISGVGCDHFEGTIPSLRDSECTHFSRLDFAFDVLTSRHDWQEFIKRAFCASIDSDRKYKKFRLTGNGEAYTIYIGDRKGSKFFRIYNKSEENPRYEFIDAETGETKEIPEGYCVIRYEVELHRHKVVSNGSVRLYDPSPAFDWYYGDDEQTALLSEEIKKLWLSYGEEVLLPAGFETVRFIPKVQAKSKFCSTSELQRLEEVKEKLHDYPHTFDSTLAYIADRFGKYLPYLLVDQTYREQCFRACEVAFGFVPDLVIETTPQGWHDLDDERDLALDDLLPWVAVAGEQLEISDYEEGGANEWS